MSPVHKSVVSRGFGTSREMMTVPAMLNSSTATSWTMLLQPANRLCTARACPDCFQRPTTWISSRATRRNSNRLVNGYRPTLLRNTADATWSLSLSKNRY
jgi:hypothetical protein